jgi:hypothetical protein
MVVRIDIYFTETEIRNVVKPANILVPMLLMTSLWCSSQSVVSLGPWYLSTVHGELDLKGQYRQLESSFNEVWEDQRSTYLLGGIKLNTRSYFWDRDVIQVDLSGAYSPEIRDEDYIVSPDRSEVRTLKKVDLRTTFCNNKPVTVQGFFNFDQNYFNRELLTNVRSNNLQWGGMVSANNKILPLTVTYRNLKWDQHETQTGRNFSMDQENVQVRVSKSFGSRDRNELVYYRNDYLYAYSGLHQTQHMTNQLALNNNLYFDTGRKYNLNSRISWYDQEGTSSFRRFEVLEGLSFQLPHQLRFTANLNLFNLKDRIQELDQKRVRTGLEHRLFESLTSKVFFEYGVLKQQAAFTLVERDSRGGFDIRYTKKIPTGTLNLNYRYYRHHHATEGETGSLSVLNEEQMLSDVAVVLLNKPYIEINTVVVKDVSGAIIYQVNFDYLLIERAGYTEIQRVPGGRIPENGVVYIDYVYRQPGTYSFAENHSHFSINLMLFNRLLELYYHYAVQNYPKVEEGELLTLNYYHQHVYGIRFHLGFARGGIESDMYRSTIIPYRMWRYYLDLNWNIRSRLQVTMNGNVRDYRMIADEVDQLYASVSGKVTYLIRPRMNVSINGGYLHQRGRNIDMDLLTSRIEFRTVFRKLHLAVGLELYRRNYLQSNFMFNGGYIQVTRKF